MGKDFLCLCLVWSTVKQKKTNFSQAYINKTYNDNEFSSDSFSDMSADAAKSALYPREDGNKSLISELRIILATTTMTFGKDEFRHGQNTI